MFHHDVRGAAHKAARARIVIAGLLLAGSAGAFAQSAAPAPAPSEAAHRAAESPFRFILLNAQPVKKAAPAAAPAAAEKPAPVETAKKPAPVETAAARPSSVATPAPAASATPEPASTPVAIAAPTSRVPEPVAAVRRELIPVRTEPPHLTGDLLRQQPNGTVRVYFEVNTDGSTGNVKVVSTSNRDLNRASIAAVQGWKFEPVDEAQSVETELVYKY